MKKIKKLGLGGGCHWCTEAVFQSVPGVAQVSQGYISSLPPNQSKSEAILIDLEDDVDIELLIDVHLQTHSSQYNHSRRDNYRSAIYYVDAKDKIILEDVVSTLSRKRNQQYVTQILAFHEFEASRIEIQNYYQSRPEAPFCQRYIQPKLERVSSILRWHEV
ncbi:peptide-methionine (S)-S-oxide reductase [Nonlabens xiamenensis]|uniref:peptide-methionine (S)-S-oxide reductase n=1 Tax=Nonlabens xiamenensis TaxID=2341043 RepID=UPI000F6120CE|nr:peptide-methionine (S)-S-oxide reductase [Nonlabens xiamenensis]